MFFVFFVTTVARAGPSRKTHPIGSDRDAPGPPAHTAASEIPDEEIRICPLVCATPLQWMTSDWNSRLRLLVRLIFARGSSQHRRDDSTDIQNAANLFSRFRSFRQIVAACEIERNDMTGENGVPARFDDRHRVIEGPPREMFGIDQHSASR